MLADLHFSEMLRWRDNFGLFIALIFTKYKFIL